MCWGCGKCVGDGGRCVKVCLECGERRGKGVGVGQCEGMWGVGRNVGQSGRAGKCGEKDVVTIRHPNPPDHNSPDPQLPQPHTPDSNFPDPNTPQPQLF